MPQRAFPIIYAEDVERSVRFYQLLGFEPHFRLPAEGEAGYVGLRRGSYELAIVTTQSPQQLIGVTVGSEPRFEMFVYVDDVDAVVERAMTKGSRTLRAVENQFYGDRTGQFEDPFGHRWSIATHVEDVPPEEMEKRMAEAMST